VLGALAVGAGHAVPADHLQLVLWADHPPAASDNTLQSYVSDLRHRFGAEIILLADHSYELNLDAVDVDALVFEGLLRRAEAARDDPAECWRLCHEALSLWRGRPFGDLADDEPFTLETHRLDALRLVAMELSMEAELRLGHHEIVAAELESAVKEQPYRERLWYLLIEALALSERRVDALRACTELRRTLAQVGIDVDDKIVALERQIINGEAVEAG
jgi:DNA-binding SARP family transcriptional activator